MKKNYSLLSILLISFLSHLGQSSYQLDINNVNARITPSSVLFYDGAATPGFLCPKGENTSCVFASSLWLGGIDSSGLLHLAADKFGQDGPEFSPGPLPIDSANSYGLLIMVVWMSLKLLLY